MARAGGNRALQLIGDIADRALERLFGGMLAGALAQQQGTRRVSLDPDGALALQRAPTQPRRSFAAASVSVAGVEPRGR